MYANSSVACMTSTSLAVQLSGRAQNTGGVSDHRRRVSGINKKSRVRGRPARDVRAGVSPLLPDEGLCKEGEGKGGSRWIEDCEMPSVLGWRFKVGLHTFSGRTAYSKNGRSTST